MNDEPLTCKYGHELTSDNLIIRRDGRWRECRACRWFDDTFAALEQRHDTNVDEDERTE